MRSEQNNQAILQAEKSLSEKWISPAKCMVALIKSDTYFSMTVEEAPTDRSEAPEAVSSVLHLLLRQSRELEESKKL